MDKPLKTAPTSNALEVTDTSNTSKKTPLKYSWRGNRKQRLFMHYWLEPSSDTFGNAYQSGLKAGFSESYSKHITSTAPLWLSEYMQKLELHPEHIKQGIAKIATGEIDSRSVDDTRLKAYELLAKYSGMDSKQTTNITVVQPILDLSSTPNRVQVDNEE